MDDLWCNGPFIAATVAVCCKRKHRMGFDDLKIKKKEKENAHKVTSV